MTYSISISRLFFYVEEAKKAEAKANLFNNVVPTWYGYFEKLLSKNGGGKNFMVGDKLTLADLSLYNICDIVEVECPGSLDKFPLLKAHRARIVARPGIKAYSESGRRPKN